MNAIRTYKGGTHPPACRPCLLLQSSVINTPPPSGLLIGADETGYPEWRHKPHFTGKNSM